MEEIFKSHPDWDDFINGRTGILTQTYQNIIFLIFHNLNGDCTVAIAPESIGEAFANQESCTNFAREAQSYLNHILSC